MPAQVHEMTEISLSGTFPGHVLPGTLFIIWAGWWIYEVVATRGGEIYRVGTLERGLAMPLCKAVLPFIGVLGELAPHGFEWKASMVNNYQHAIMYFGFIVAGGIDLLARSGRISPGATYLAYGGAALNTAMLFAGHGHMGGLPDTVHQLLVVLFAAAATLAVVEMRFPDSGVAWLRIGTLLLTGVWLWWIAWLLYRSGYDLADHVSQMKAYLFFSASAMGVAMLLLTVHQLIGAPRRYVTSPAGEGRSRVAPPA